MMRWSTLLLIAVVWEVACLAASGQIDDALRAGPSGADPNEPSQQSTISNGAPRGEAMASTEAARPRFRRVYVPEKDLLDRIKTGRRYIPMKAAEFASQVAERRAGSEPAVESPANLAYATYAAALDDNFQLTGRGAWTVQFAGKEPALLRLPGLGFALREPVWSPREAGSRGEAARLGSTVGNQSALYVDRSGTVQFDWSLRGLHDRDGAWVYPLSLPPAPSQQLELTLPGAWVVIVDGGIVTAEGDDHQASRRWTIRLPGRSQAELRIVKKDSPLARRPTVVVKPRLTYEATPLGLQLAADLRIDVHGGSINDLQLELDPALTLASARIGDATIGVTEHSDDGRKRLTLEFPEPLEGNNRLIRLTAIAPPTLDRSWLLPKLHFRQMIWQDGTITLVVPAPLTLNKLDLSECRQTKREALPGPLIGEAIGIQAFTPAADVTIHLTQQPDRLRLTSATTVDLSGDEARATYVADITAETGERFELTADISPDWIIDSVQSSPAGLISDWDRTRSQSNAGRLVVHLARAINSQRPLRLMVQATRRRAPLGDLLTVGNLELLSFEKIARGRRLMLVRTTGLYRLDQQSAEAVTRLDPKNLEPNDRSLLGDAPRGLLFVLDDAADDLKLRLLQEKPRFSALVQTLAVVGDDELMESYRLQIAPESGELEVLRVHFSQRREASFNWSIEDNPSYEVVARRLSGEEPAAVGKSAETWELKFRPALAEPIELVIARRSRLESTTPVSLPSLSDATSQQGSVSVELAGDFVPKVEQRRLRSLALEPPRSGRQQNVLNAFEYDPAEAFLAAEAPSLVLHVERGVQNHRPAWIWRCDLNSWFSNSDSALHRATLFVENAGRTNLILDVDAADGPPEVYVDGLRQVDGVLYAADGRLTVPLPAGRRFCSLEIQWNTPASGLAGFSTRGVAWPVADVPMLARSATVWLPSGYMVANTSQVRSSSAAEIPSWRQRLFGPLGRGTDGETFEPWLARDWSRLRREFSDVALVRRCASQFLQQPLSDSAEYDNPNDRSARATSIGEQLDRAWRQAGRAFSTMPPLFVHVEALKRAGISPSTVAAADGDQGNAPTDIGELLDHAGLALCFDAQRVLLTTRRWAASACDPSFAASREPLGELGSSRVIDRLLSSTSSSAIDVAVPLEIWLALPAGVQSPWPMANLADKRDQTPYGWVAFPVEWLAEDRELRIWIIRRDTLLALGSGVFLTAAGLVWRMGGARPLVRAISLAILAMAALLVPVDFVPLGAAAVLGFLTGELCRWCFRPPAQAARRIALEVAGPAAATATMLLLLTIARPQAAAQEPDNRLRAPDNANIYDVLIPIDENETIAGEIVYVPDELYRALAAQKVGQSFDAPRFLVKSAMYEPIGKGPAAGKPATGHDWQAAYTIETLKPATEVALPLAAVGADLIPDGAKIDGRPLRFAWNPKRTAIVFNVNKPGSYQVQFLFRPRAQRATDGFAFNVSVPAVLDARVRVHAAEAGRGPRVDARGGSRFDRRTGQLEFDLGPIEHLAVDWNDTAGQRMPAQFEAGELTWLRMRPGSAVLNARLIVDVRQGEVDELRLAVDRRLAFMSAADETGQIHAAATADGSELRLALGQSVTDRAVVDLAFAVDGVAAAGEFAWPKMRLLDGQNTRRYAAWSIDPSLEWTASPAAEMKPLASSQFAALWGEADARAVAYELPAVDAPWHLDVRPRQPRLQTSDRTIAIVERDWVSVDWTASLEITAGSRFQLRAAAPPELIVDDVEVRDAAGVRPSRWARSADHTLSVFFDAPATGKQQVVVRARIPVDATASASVPLLRIDDAQCGSHSLLVFRRQNALATVRERAGVRALSAAEAARLVDQFAASGLVELSRFKELRFIAALDAQMDARTVALEVQENRPKIDAVQAISLSKSGDAWHAALDLKLNVRAGLLDTIRIDVPSSWSGPFRIEPPIPFKLLDVLGETRRHFLLTPAEPIAEETQLRIEGPLALQPGQRVRAPDARLVGAANLQEFYALPSQQQLRTLAWDTRGLKPEPIPAGLMQLPAAVGAYQTFARAAEEFRAELRSVENIADDVQVRLADISVHWDNDRSCYGTAAFDVEPAGRTSCRLALPPKSQLINLSVDGRPLAIEPAGDERWTVPLSGGRLPQRIEIIFSGQVTAETGAPQHLEGPRLIGLPVERTLWTVSGPGSAGAAQPALAESTSALRQEAARHESIAAVIESAANALAETSADETPRWYAPWAGYLTTAHRSLERQSALGTVGDSDREANAKAALIAEDQYYLAQRLGVGAMLDQWTNSAPPADSATAVWRATLPSDAVASHAILLGENSSLGLDYPRQTAGDFGLRIVQVLVVALVLLLAAGLSIYSPLPAWISTRPRAIGVAIGVFWWLFLWPSALGWVIVLASLAAGRLGRLSPRRFRRGPRPRMA